MKLNHECVRDILLFIEENLNYESINSKTSSVHKEIVNGELISNDNFKKHNQQELIYALELLIKE